MKTAKLLLVTLVTLASFPLVAQQVNAAASQNSSASVSTAAAIEMRPVNCELVSKLDTKSAKPGDVVEVKTTDSVKTADGTVIPKGSILIGHVTEVQAHGKESADSHLAILFDHAELKGGQSIRVLSEIRSVAPPVSLVAASSMDSEDAFGGGGMGGARASSGSMGGMRMGGGPLNGSSNESLGQLANSTGQAKTDLDTMADSAQHRSGSAVTRAGDQADLAAHTAGGIATHATAIPGVMLTGRASASASGTLSAAKKNIHLDAGTQMGVGVAAAK